MDVTLACEYTKRSMDLGYIGFNRLRNKIAELAGEPFLSHYAKLDNLSFGTEKDSPMNNPESRAAFRPSYEAEPEVGAQGEIAALCVRVAP